MKWEEVNQVIKWTLKNAKYLELDDTYLIEKATDICHLAISHGKIEDETCKH